MMSFSGRQLLRTVVHLEVVHLKLVDQKVFVAVSGHSEDDVSRESMRLNDLVILVLVRHDWVNQTWADITW